MFSAVFAARFERVFIREPPGSPTRSSAVRYVDDDEHLVTHERAERVVLACCGLPTTLYDRVLLARSCPLIRAGRP